MTQKGKKGKQIPEDKCEDKRQTKREGEQEVKKATLTLEQIGDFPVAITAFAGCIEGDRATYAAKGDDRNILLYGTADQIANYTIGKKVEIKVGKATMTFQRNIGRKQELAVGNIKQEMTGKGEGIEAIMKKEKKGAHNGYTISVNGQKVTPSSVINSYFTEKVLEQDGKQVKYLGGVEMVISAIIKPGMDYHRAR